MLLRRTVSFRGPGRGKCSCIVCSFFPSKHCLMSTLQSSSKDGGWENSSRNLTNTPGNGKLDMSSFKKNGLTLAPASRSRSAIPSWFGLSEKQTSSNGVIFPLWTSQRTILLRRNMLDTAVDSVAVLLTPANAWISKATMVGSFISQARCSSSFHVKSKCGPTMTFVCAPCNKRSLTVFLARRFIAHLSDVYPSRSLTFGSAPCSNRIWGTYRQ